MVMNSLLLYFNTQSVLSPPIQQCATPETKDDENLIREIFNSLHMSDLIITSIEVPNAIPPDSTGNVTVTVANAGVQTHASSLMFILWLDEEGVVSACNTEGSNVTLNTQGFTVIEVGASKQFTFVNVQFGGSGDQQMQVALTHAAVSVFVVWGLACWLGAWMGCMQIDGLDEEETGDCRLYYFEGLAVAHHYKIFPFHPSKFQQGLCTGTDFSDSSNVEADFKTSLVLDPAQPLVNAPTKATATVTNIGGVTATLKTIAFFPDQPDHVACGAQGGFVSNVDVTLAPGESTVDFYYHYYLDTGAKTMRAVADINCDTDERGKTANDQAAITFTPAMAPNLLVTSVSRMSIVPFSGGTVNVVSVSISNMGPGAVSSDTHVTVRLWTGPGHPDKACNDGSASAEMMIPGGLQPLATYVAESAPLFVPSSGVGDSLLIRAFVDATCTISEWDEGNNQFVLFT